MTTELIDPLPHPTAAHTGQTGADDTRLPTDGAAGSTGIARWEGRVFGGIVLGAFLLYGLGSATADHPVGLVLVVVNSIAVAVAGLIGFRLLRSSRPRVGLAYLGARIAEGALLVGGIALSELADAPDAGDAMYQLAMVVLGVGSVPFFHAFGRERRLPAPLAVWGTIAYAALATGALVELVTGQAVAIPLSIPGGLFELTLGVFLIRGGFRVPPRAEGRTDPERAPHQRRPADMATACHASP